MTANESFYRNIDCILESIVNDKLLKNERIITTPQSPKITLADGSKVINFCANNYLGFADDNELITTAKQALDEYGYGVASVRFICGTQTIHTQLEATISNFLGTEATILYSSCFDANGGLFETILTDNDAIKPMNCPGHIQIFNQRLVSYRELPIRFGEFGSCHRNEASGALHGLMRTRNFVQDDGHIFCTQEQIESEVSIFIDMLFEVYNKFELGNNMVGIKISTRPEKRLGSDELWDLAENSLMNALKNKNLDYQIQVGDGAFYGPKIEFTIKDCIGRLWTTGTIQLDFNLPLRLGATYIANDSSKQVPVMLHRAICGSLERFIGMLIENYMGNLPLWLSPIQIIVLNISEKQLTYATEIYQTLKRQSIRVKYDLSNQKISYKIREHTLQKIPYLLIVGDKEQENNIVTIRKNNGDSLGSLTLEQFVTNIKPQLN